MKRRGALLLGLTAAGVIVLALVAALIFQDALVRWRLSPSVPFQVATPPPPPDYASRAAWLLWPDEPDEDAGVGVFYVHSTTYYSNDGWNAPADGADPTLAASAAPNEAGPFQRLGAIHAPLYRQATLFSFFTHKFDGVAARRLAYMDVRRAFERFLSETDSKRPILLAGYGQGGLHVLGLLREYFQHDEALRKRLAVAYVIGQAVPLDLFEAQLAATPPCRAPGETRCVVSYTDLEHRFRDEMRRARERSMVWTNAGDLAATRGRALLCVNPLTWRETGEYAGPDLHKGAASATGLRFGEPPPPVLRAIGAQCIDGVLVVDRPKQAFLRRGDWFGAEWRTPNFNLFYADLAADAQERVDAVAALIEHEYRYLAPIEEALDIEDSPISPVPN